MKTRVISGIIGGLVGIAVVIFTFSPYLDVMCFGLSLMSVYELMKVFGVKNKAMYVLSLAFSALVIVQGGYGEKIGISFPVGAVVTAYVLAMLILMLADYEHITFEQAGLSMVVSFLLPSALTCFLKIRKLTGEFANISRGHCRFLVWFCLASAVFTDTFAYFSGVKLGKHKLCPKISPKKTVEGAVGGILGTLVINLASLAICNAWVFHRAIPIPLWVMAIFSVVLSVISMLGDLSASTIKRNFGIKDFGNIIPGHGGIMDRMDSISFVAPVVYFTTVILVKAFG